MCEIIVLDPERIANDQIHAIAQKFHEEQGDGLGILAVMDDGERFTYEAYKSVHPHWYTFAQFLNRTRDRAWRYVIHGRAMTAGKVNRQNAHPLKITCGNDECEYEWVVHNGSVRNHQQRRASLTSHGHTFNTTVDSEVIAHTVTTVPDSVEDFDRDTYSLEGNLNWLAFSNEGILVRTSRKYSLSDEFTMTCSRRMFEDPKDAGFPRDKSTQFLLAKPGGDIETEGYSSYTSTRSSRTVTNAGMGGQSHGNHWGQGASSSHTSRSGNNSGSSANTGPSDDTYVVEYHDHCSRYEHITVIKPAEGVIRIIDTDAGKSHTVFRNDNPKSYYFYAPDPKPENLDQLHEIAQADSKQDVLAAFEEDDEGNVNEAVAESSAQTIIDMTVNEVADVSEDILDVMAKTSSNERAT